MLATIRDNTRHVLKHAAHNPKFEKMMSFRHPRWQHLDYRVKVATTQNKPPTQGTRQWTFTTPRWRCGSILLAKNCLPQIGSKVLLRFREKYRALGRQKNGSNMRPRYIQFRDIHDRDISGLHCICNVFKNMFNVGLMIM